MLIISLLYVFLIVTVDATAAKCMRVPDSCSLPCGIKRQEDWQCEREKTEAFLL